MSDWSKIDSVAAEDNSAASSALAAFFRRNISALSASRHMGAGSAYDPNGTPIVSSGSNFRVEVPVLIPAESWATGASVTVSGAAHKGNVDVSLAIAGEEGAPVTFTGGTETLTCSCQFPSGQTGFVIGAIRIQSTAANTGAVGSAYMEDGGRRVRIDVTAGAWPWPAGTIHAELHITILSSDSTETPEIYAGTGYAAPGTNEQVEIWPPIEEPGEWDAIAGSTKPHTVGIFEMSSLEVFGFGVELTGDSYGEADRHIEPGARIAAASVWGLAHSLALLKSERRHWHCCGFTPMNFGAGTIRFLAHGNFGGVLDHRWNGQPQSTIASFPCEVREYTRGITIALAYAQIGDRGSRYFRPRVTIAGVTHDAPQIHTLAPFPEGLLTEHGRVAANRWGTEDALLEGESDGLTVSTAFIPWPAGVAAGDLVFVEVAIDDEGVNGAPSFARLCAFSAVESIEGAQ